MGSANKPDYNNLCLKFLEFRLYMLRVQATLVKTEIWEPKIIPGFTYSLYTLVGGSQPQPSAGLPLTSPAVS